MSRYYGGDIMKVRPITRALPKGEIEKEALNRRRIRWPV